MNVLKQVIGAILLLGIGAAVAATIIFSTSALQDDRDEPSIGAPVPTATPIATATPWWIQR